jgi:hypothetical protein
MLSLGFYLHGGWRRRSVVLGRPDPMGVAE